MKTKILIIAFLFVSVSVSALLFVGIAENYVHNNGKWYFGNIMNEESLKEVIGADTLTFEVLCDENYSHCFYAKDKNYVYHKGERIEGADLNNFVVIFPQTSYSKDDKNVYFESKKIEEADLQTFELVNSNSMYIHFLSYAKDKNSIFKNGVRMAYDVSTFKLLFEEKPYTADKSGIYFNDNLLKGSLSEDYRILKNTIYLISNNKVFFQETEIKGADVATFEITENKYAFNNGLYKNKIDYTIAKDKNFIYLNHQCLTEIDVKTFEIVEKNDIKVDLWKGYYKSVGDAIIKDKNGTYQIKKEGEKFILIKIINK